MTPLSTFLTAFLVFSCSSLVSCDLAAHARLAEVESVSKSPVDRVLELLKEMKGQLERDATEDEETYRKMQCWCDSGEKSTTKKIAQADADIAELQSEVEGSSAKTAELATRVEQLSAELAKQKASFKTARAIREKGQAAFSAEEKDMVEAVTMLNNALLILGRHNAGLLQVTPAIRESMGSALRWVALKHEEMTALHMQRPSLRGRTAAFLSLSTTGQAASGVESVVLAALQGSKGAHNTVKLPVEYGARVLAAAAEAMPPMSSDASFAQQPAHLQGYTTQSGQIFGVLKQMLDEFEANLNQAQKSEVLAKESYAELKTASEQQISASAKLIDELQAEHASTLKALSDAKETLTSTRETRSADVKFLSDIRLQCQDLDHQWEQRSRGRGEEIKAVGDAIVILTEDDARTLFHKKMGGAPTLVQVHSHTARATASDAAAMKRHASSVLLRMARKLLATNHASVSGERLAALAVGVKTEALSEVNQAINDMIADLEVQQKTEVSKKANCSTELRTTEKETYASKERIEDLETKIATLQATAQQLTAEIADAHGSIAETKLAVKTAGENRGAENKEFQQEIADQRMIQNLLKKAIARLSAVYSAADGSAFLQQEPTSPHKFQTYNQNAGASGVVSLLESIVGDSATLEKEASEAEQESQKAYETFVRDSTATVKRLNATIEAKDRQHADVTLDEEEANTEKSSEASVLEDLETYTTDLHVQCDFILKNFTIRQKARLQEIEALKEAMAFLSGMMAEK